MTTHVVDIGDVEEKIEHYRKLERAGVEPSSLGDFGPTMYIWRRFRDGRETVEALPEFLARATVACIPVNEPNVERAKLMESRS